MKLQIVVLEAHNTSIHYQDGVSSAQARTATQRESPYLGFCVCCVSDAPAAERDRNPSARSASQVLGSSSNMGPGPGAEFGHAGCAERPVISKAQDVFASSFHQPRSCAAVPDELLLRRFPLAQATPLYARSKGTVSLAVFEAHYAVAQS